MIAPSRSTDPETSRNEVPITEHQRWIMYVLEETDRLVRADQPAGHNGLSDEAIEEAARLVGYEGSGQSLRSRRAELVRKGLVEHWDYTVNLAGRRVRTWKRTP